MAVRCFSYRQEGCPLMVVFVRSKRGHLFSLLMVRVIQQQNKPKVECFYLATEAIQQYYRRGGNMEESRRKIHITQASNAKLKEQGNKQHRKIKLKVQSKMIPSATTTNHSLSRKQSILGDTHNDNTCIERKQSQKIRRSPSVNLLPPTKQPSVTHLNKNWHVQSLSEHLKSATTVPKRLSTNPSLTIDLAIPPGSRPHSPSPDKRSDKWHRTLSRNNSRESKREEAVRRIQGQLLNNSLDSNELLSLFRGCDISGQQECRWGVLAVDLMYSKQRKQSSFKASLRG